MRIETSLLVLVAVFAFLIFLMLRSYLTYIIFSAILVLVSFPLYKKLKSKLKNRHLSAIILIISMLLLVIVPTFFLSLKLFTQAKDIFTNIEISGEKISEKIYSLAGVDVKENIKLLTSNIVSFTITNIFALTKTVTKLFIGLFIMLFTMFYLYIDSENITGKIKKLIPLNEKHTNYLITHTYNITQALLIGIFFTALLQGMFGGIGFFLFGIHNALFWGFVMAFLSLIPFLGPHFVYIPASIFLMFKGNFLAGIGLLIYGIIVVSNLDNIIRPRIVRFRAKIHPLIVILGVIGGIALMGISGMIIGPLILALFLELVKVYNLVKKGK